MGHGPLSEWKSSNDNRGSLGLCEYSTFLNTQANNRVMNTNFEANPEPMFEFRIDANTILGPNIFE